MRLEIKHLLVVVVILVALILLASTIGIIDIKL